MAKTAEEYLADLKREGVSEPLLRTAIEMLGQGSAAMDVARKVQAGLSEHGITLPQLSAALEAKPEPVRASVPKQEPVASPAVAQPPPERPYSRQGCAPQARLPRLGSPFGGAPAPRREPATPVKPQFA